MDLISKNAVLTKRIFNGGWEQFGNIKRKPDSRTTKQLLENIDYFAEKFPEVAQFKKELKSINLSATSFKKSHNSFFLRT